MTATDKQIDYLCRLAGRVEALKAYKDNILGLDTPFIDWQTERHKGVTTDDASVRIDAYRTIIFNANLKRDLLGV